MKSLLECAQGVAPAYVQELCLLLESVPGCPWLFILHRLGVHTSTGQQSFAFCGPAVWSTAASPVRHQSVTEHFQTETENASLRRTSSDNAVMFL